MSWDDWLAAEQSALAAKLDDLRGKYKVDEAFPDVVAVWEAIQRISRLNRELLEQEKVPYPLPGWINDYLLKSADKISRLSLGIKPDDERPLNSMNINEVGELRKVCRSDRNGDGRSGHVASALGFVRQGKSAFKNHDQMERYAEYHEIYNNPGIGKNGRREHQRAVLRLMMKNENLGSEQSARNRLSKARTSQRSRSPSQ